MAEGIPADFDRAWSKSDVVLRTMNSEGKELHANKAVLSVFSPYFDALFSGRFAEKDMNSVDVNCSYYAMKEILRNIHQVDFSYKPNGMKQYDAQMLKQLYMAGDYYNFRHIRRLCLEQMTERPSVGMAMTASELGLRKIVMDILMRLEGDKVRRFLGNDNVDYLFTKQEVLRLYEYIFGIPLPRGTAASKKSSTRRLNLEEITEEIQNPRIDLTELWDLADVAIVTKNSRGRLLYSNKTVIDIVSTKFKNLLLTPFFLKEEDRSILFTTIDVEFATMKEILSVLHHCDINSHDSPRVLHPALLHSMYKAASEDQLDIPMIRDLCVAKLLKQESLNCFEVLVDLDRAESVSLSRSEWCEWVHRKDEHLSYWKGEKVVVVTPSQNKPHFKKWMVLFLINLTW